MVLSLVQQGLNTWLSVTPGARVQRFFLGPDNVLGIGVAVQVLLELRPREGVQLLNTGNGRVANVVSLTVFHKCSVNLARANDHTLNLLRFIDGLSVVWVRDDPAEVRITGEFRKRGTSKRMTQERFREENDESWGRGKLFMLVLIYPVKVQQEPGYEKYVRLRNWR